jgi:ribonuclease P protein component
LTQTSHGYIERAHFKDYRCYCEAHIPAEQAGAGTPSRLPRSDGDKERSSGVGSSPREGPQAPFRLSGIFMRAALQRLKKRSEFLAVAATNRRWTTPGLVLQARALDAQSDFDDLSASDDLSPAHQIRVGFTATKKVGNAVKRNRARRRLRAAIDDVLRDRPEEAAFADIVVVARQGTLTRPYAALKDDLSQSLRRLKILA